MAALSSSEKIEYHREILISSGIFCTHEMHKLNKKRL